MPKVRFETGQVVNFESMPSQADIDEVAGKLGIGKQQDSFKQYTYGDAIKDSVPTLTKSLGNAASNIVEPFRHPLQAAKGLANVARHPIQAGKAIAGSLKESYGPQDVYDERLGNNVPAWAHTIVNDPFKFVGDVATAGGLASGVGKLSGSKAIGNATSLKASGQALQSGAANTEDLIKKAWVAAKSAPKNAVNNIKTAVDNRTVRGRINELKKIENDNASIRKVIKNADSKGIDVKKELANTDLLHGAIDNNGTLRTENAINKLNEFIKPQEDVIRKNLIAENKTIPLGEVKSRLVDAVNNSSLKGGAKLRALRTVNQDIKGYALDAVTVDGEPHLPISMVHDAKVDKYANINYLNPESNRIDKVVAKTLKNIVEEKTSSVDVKNLNNELSKYYSMHNLLDKLNGKKISGGKAGKYVAELVGSMVGSHFGPFGTVAGAEIGGAVKGGMLGSKFGGKINKSLTSSSDMQKAIKTGK